MEVRKMINKEELLEALQEFDYFIVDKLVNLTTGGRRGIMQTSIYDKVKLEWKGLCFKFWNKQDKDVKLYLDADIEDAEFDDGILTLHIQNCPEDIKIRCCKRIH